MKQKLLLLIVMLAFIGLNARSQTLYNTTWMVYKSPGVFYYYVHLSTSTVSFSSNNTAYYTSSSFQENGNNFSIYDLIGGCGTDTGKYTFVIQNDTLKFTLVSDGCDTRVKIQTTYYWVWLATGIQSPGLISSVKLYPNPVSDGIVHLSFPAGDGFNIVSVYNIVGKKAFEENISGSSQVEINLKNLPRGVYIVIANNKEKQFIQKLVIE